MFITKLKYVNDIFLLTDKLIRHRACCLKDTAYALVMTQLDDEFEKICHDIQSARKERGMLILNYCK